MSLTEHQQEVTVTGCGLAALQLIRLRCEVEQLGLDIASVAASAADNNEQLTRATLAESAQSLAAAHEALTQIAIGMQGVERELAPRVELAGGPL